MQVKARNFGEFSVFHKFTYGCFFDVMNANVEHSQDEVMVSLETCLSSAFIWNGSFCRSADGTPDSTKGEGEKKEGFLHLKSF